MKTSYEQARETFEREYPALNPSIVAPCELAKHGTLERPYKYQHTNDNFELCRRMFMAGMKADNVRERCLEALWQSVKADLGLPETAGQIEISNEIFRLQQAAGENQ
ncbi:hypothetical protein SopranoGao_43 [Klebsiella phage SopranoGao]|uniref:Uncharacterized protein n=1 Tax=Klebsiella phage SopranoGao TaxID=2026944 RepID=A0A248SL91_9CAUD|nr:hypothetical protein KMC54_gp43 [Klebsiella phage SopranoGao]ASV45066.1 hypothetical protein SopranoGao_43 [Klebsiella phage SopranoGao]